MNLKQQARQAIKWTALGRFGAQLFSWASTILVVRWLHPEDYGVMAMAESVWILLYGVGNLGLGERLIQKKTNHPDEFQWVLGTLLLFNGLLALALLIIAPMVGNYYQTPTATTVLWAISPLFLLLPFITVYNAKLARELQFEGRAKVDLVVAVVTAITTLVCAVTGFGVWSLVAGMYADQILKTIAYGQLTRVGIPKFNVSRVRPDIRFGLSVTAGALLWSTYTKVDVIIGGKYLSASEIGIYAVALHLATLLMSKAMPLVHEVALPLYSEALRQDHDIRPQVLKTTEVFSIIIFPVFFGLAAVTPQLIPMVLGDTWNAVITPMMILSIVIPFRFILYSFSPALTAIGKPQIEWQNHLITLACLLLALPFGAQHGATGLAWAWAGAFPLAFLFGAIRSTKAINLSVKLMFRGVWVPLVASTTMYLLVRWLGLHWFLSALPASLIVSILLGALSYITLIYILHRKAFSLVRHFLT